MFFPPGDENGCFDPFTPRPERWAPLICTTYCPGRAYINSLGASPSSTGVFRDLVGLLSCLFITLALWGCTHSFSFALFKRLFTVRKQLKSKFPCDAGFRIFYLERNCFSSFTHLFAKMPVNGPSAFPKMNPLPWKHGDSFSMVVRSFV